MGLTVVAKKDSEGQIQYLGKVYEPGYHYSEVTHEDAGFRETWKPLKEFLGEDRDSGITIFVSRDGAQKYIKDNHLNAFALSIETLEAFI